MKAGRKPEYPEKTLGDELQKMPHITARRFKTQARLEPAQLHWWQARKADMLTVTRHSLQHDRQYDVLTCVPKMAVSYFSMAAMSVYSLPVGALKESVLFFSLTTKFLCDNLVQLS